MISLDPEILQALEKQADQEGVDVRTLVNALLDHGLDEVDSAGVVPVGVEIAGDGERAMVRPSPGPGTKCRESIRWR